jgi:hypothetical protein
MPSRFVTFPAQVPIGSGFGTLQFDLALQSFDRYTLPHRVHLHLSFGSVSGVHCIFMEDEE